MKPEIAAKILEPILNSYFSDEADFISLPATGLQTKEQVGRIGNMRIAIYTNDHNPPHFHVYSNDRKIDAKFRIDNCELLGGPISPADKKKVRRFYNDPKMGLYDGSME